MGWVASHRDGPRRGRNVDANRIVLAVVGLTGTKIEGDHAMRGFWMSVPQLLGAALDEGAKLQRRGGAANIDF